MIVHRPQSLSLFPLLAVCLLAGCLFQDNNPVDVIDEDPPVLLGIRVDDADGLPVPGLEIKYQVHIPGFEQKTDRPDKAMTVIRYQLLSEVHASLTVYDLRDRVVRALLDEMRPAGVHTVGFNGRDDHDASLLGTQVLRYELVLRDSADTGEEVFRESRYMVMNLSPDWQQSVVLGSTDAGGRVAEADSLLFPFLLDLPELRGRDEMEEDAGPIIFSPTISLLITDPQSGQWMSSEVDMTGGATDVTIIWNPQAHDAADIRITPSGIGSAKDRPDEHPVEWVLEQNYPNPFN